MNKPIRTISIFCLLLFLALMVNATYLQYSAGAARQRRPVNRRVIEASFSRERGAILVGRDAVAESVKSDDEYEFQRTYSQPLKYAPVTGWFSYYSQTGIEQSQNDVLSGDDSLLFVTRLVDLLSNYAPKGGSVQLTARRRRADRRVRRPARPSARTCRARWWRWSRPTGKILAMVSNPTYDPNKLASHDFGAVADTVRAGSARTPTSRCSTGRSRRRCRPGSTFKIVTAAAAHRERQLHRSTRWCPAARPTSCRRPRTRPAHHNERPRLRHHRIPMIQAMEQSCNTTFAALADEVGAEAMHDQAEAFGFNTPVPRGPRSAGRVQVPRGRGRRAERAVRLRPGQRHRHPAPDGDGGGRRSPTAAP